MEIMIPCPNLCIHQRCQQHLTLAYPSLLTLQSLGATLLAQPSAKTRQLWRPWPNASKVVNRLPIDRVPLIYPCWHNKRLEPPRLATLTQQLWANLSLAHSSKMMQRCSAHRWISIGRCVRTSIGFKSSYRRELKKISWLKSRSKLQWRTEWELLVW